MKRPSPHRVEFLRPSRLLRPVEQENGQGHAEDRGIISEGSEQLNEQNHSKLKANMGVRIAAVVFFGMCTGQVAIAEGIEVPPNFYDWTGMYIGANGGYGI